MVTIKPGLLLADTRLMGGGWIYRMTGARELQRNQMQPVKPAGQAKAEVPIVAAGDWVPAIERQPHEPKV